MKTMLTLTAVARLLPSGCAFGTNRVTLPSALTVPLPARGDQLAVQVKDGRSDLSGAQVAFTRTRAGSHRE